MTSRLLRAAAILTIFLGLCGFVALTDTPAVSTTEIQSSGYPEIFFLEEPGLITVRLPLDAIKTFSVWKPNRFVGATTYIRDQDFLMNLTTQLRTEGFEMYVNGPPIQFEFESGYLIAHFILSNVHAHFSDKSEFFIIDPSGRIEAFMDEGLQKLVLGPEDDAHFFGHFSVTKVDPRTGSSAPIREDDHFVSQIVVEPLLKPILYKTILGGTRPLQTVAFNFREQFGSENVDLEMLKTLVYEFFEVRPEIPILVLND